MSGNPLSSIPPIGPTTGMAPAPLSGRFKPIDPLRVLRQYALVLVLSVLVGFGGGMGIWFLMLKTMPRWTSIARCQVDVSAASAWATNDNQANNLNSDAVARAINGEIVLIKSPEFLRKVVTRQEVQQTAWFKGIKKEAGASDNPIQLARESLQNYLLSANMLPNTALFQLSVSTRRPKDAVTILSALLDVYQTQLKIESNNQGSDLQRVFLKEQDRASRQVQQLQQKLENFTTQENLTTLKSESSDASINYHTLATRQSELSVALDQAETQHDAMVSQLKSGNLKPGPDDEAAVEAMPAVQNLEQQIRQMKQQREVLLERFGENHRSVRQINRQIEIAQQQRRDKLASLLRQRQAVQVAQAAQSVESIKQELAKLNPELTEASARMADLTNRLTTYHQIKDQLILARQQQEKANQSLTNLRMRQSRPDAVPVKVRAGASTPVLTSPKKAVVVPGVTILVLVMVASLVFLKELLDQRVKSPADVKLIESVDLLGVIPDAAEDPSGVTTVERAVALQPTGLLAESFRQVRTAVLAKMDRRGYKTLVIVGAQPACGASSVAANLAASLVYNGRRVLLMDANFRRPGQHTLHELDNDRGLVEVLRGQATAEQVLLSVEGMSLAIMPAGHGAGAEPELLEGQAFRVLLSELEKQFDVILIDASPALLSSESRLLAKQVDALAMVARAGRDKRGMIARMTRQLDGQRADLLGVILNGVRSSAGGYFRKSYHDFYRYGENGKADDGRRRSLRAAAARGSAETIKPH